MNCQQVEPLVGAYADGETDALRSFSIKRHLARCPRCAAAHADILSLRARIRAEVPAFTASPALQARVRAMASAVDAAAPARPRAAARQRVGWMTGGAVAGCVATVFAWTLGTSLVASRAGDDFEVAAVATHGRAAVADQLVQVASSDRHTVKPWLSARLDYSPPVVDLASEGFPLICGRIDTIGGRPVAALVYGYGRHTIDVFVRPRESGAPPLTPREMRGFHVVPASATSMEWLAVSDAEPEAVKGLVQRLAREEGTR